MDDQGIGSIGSCFLGGCSEGHHWGPTPPLCELSLASYRDAKSLGVSASTVPVLRALRTRLLLGMVCSNWTSKQGGFLTRYGPAGKCGRRVVELPTA